MLILLKYWKQLTILGLVIGLLVGYNLWAAHQQQLGEARATGKYNALVDAQKREAAEKLASETAKVVAKERTLQDLKNQQEVKDARNKKTMDNLTARLHDLAGPAGRLRDPKARSRDCSDPASGTVAAGPGDSRDHGTEAGRLLSAELTDLLRRLTAEADEINNAYASCREDSHGLRAAIE